MHIQHALNRQHALNGFTLLQDSHFLSSFPVPFLHPYHFPCSFPVNSRPGFSLSCVTASKAGGHWPREVNPSQRLSAFVA